MFVFFWPFNCFINNVINLLKVMHYFLHQKQECCQRLSQSIYSHVLYDSIGTKLFIYKYVLSTWYWAPCSSQYLPQFSSILWFASVLSYKFQSLCFFPFPQKEKNNTLTPSTFLYKLSPITVASISEQQQEGLPTQNF